MHLYPDYTPADDLAWTVTFLETHDNVSVAANKPAILEEYGVARSGSRFNRASTYAVWHEVVYNSTAINGDMTWATIQILGGCPNGAQRF